MSADFSQVRDLAADLAKAGPKQMLLAQRVIVKTAHDIEGTAKQLAAVDTGMMRGSIGSDIRPLQAIIGPTVDYAPFVEFGTSRAAPQPFMGPAAARHEPGYYQAMEQVLGGLL